jgi:nucleoside-triphosphatase
MASAFLLTGNPGTGKTTLIRKALAFYSGKAGGFYTAEIKENGVRLGFKLVTIDGTESVLSHVSIRSTYRVGKYGVDLKTMDNIAADAIEKAVQDKLLIIIDEIGKMELFSEKFKSIVLKALDSGRPILGTVMIKSNSFADEVKRRSDVNLVVVTADNRDLVLAEIKKWLFNQTDENITTTPGEN